MSVQRVGDMELEQDLTFQRRSWRVQRIGLVVWILVMLAAVAGLLGGGPLSDATVGASGLFQVQYERFVRHGAPTLLEIQLEAGAVQDEARVWIDKVYLQGVQIQTTYPEPDSVEAGADGLTYVFKLDEPGQPTSIIFNVMYEPIGLHQGRIALDDGEPVNFSHFIYP